MCRGCLDINRLSELYPRAKGYIKAHRMPVRVVNNDFNPLKTIFGDRALRSGTGNFSLNSSVGPASFSTFLRRNKGSARVTRSVSSLSDE